MISKVLSNFLSDMDRDIGIPKRVAKIIREQWSWRERDILSGKGGGESIIWVIGFKVVIRS